MSTQSPSVAGVSPRGLDPDDRDDRDEVGALPYVPSVLDADLAPDDVAAWAACVTPGSVVVTALAGVDPRRLSVAGRIDALVAWEKQLAWLHAAQHRLLAVMVAAAPDQSVDGLDKDWLREEVAAALRLSGVTASARLQLARELDRLPATLDMLGRGEITALHARTLAEAVCGLDDELAHAVETRVLADAGDQSLASFTRSVRRAVEVVSAPTAEQRHQRAVTDRRVVCTPAPDGMSEIWALLPAQGARALMSAIDALAQRADPKDLRTADQRRADALTHLGVAALHGEPATHTPTHEPTGRNRLRPTIQVTVALSTLLALDEQPAELDGHGTIPAALARALAHDPTGTWRRLVTDPLGHLLDYGRSTYRPPTALAQHVIARDRTCRFPHCNRNAHNGDLDHRTPWNDGGHTNTDNLHALCSRHHHLKHDTRWNTTRHPDGSTHWRSPTGHTYRKPPEPYPIDTTTQTPRTTTPPTPKPPPPQPPPLPTTPPF